MAGNAGMENLIPIVNKLQDAFTSLGVHMQLGGYFIFNVFSILRKNRYCPHFVRALSIRPSVIVTTFHGVGRSCSYLSQSIAYGPRTKKGHFLGLVFSSPPGRPEVQIPL
jgi:hypothetical protein